MRCNLAKILPDYGVKIWGVGKGAVISASD